MTATKTVRPATAPAVTRILVAAGFDKSETYTTAVRGYNTFTTGISSSNEVDTVSRRAQRGSYRDGSPRWTTERTNMPTGRVFVGYTFGGWSGDRLSRDERNAKIADVMAKAAEVLTGKGFTVEVVEDASGESGLIVSRVAADGSIVRF